MSRAVLATPYNPSEWTHAENVCHGQRGGLASGERRRGRTQWRDGMIGMRVARGEASRPVGRRYGISHVRVLAICRRDGVLTEANSVSERERNDEDSNQQSIGGRADGFPPGVCGCRIRVKRAEGDWQCRSCGRRATYEQFATEATTRRQSDDAATQTTVRRPAATRWQRLRLRRLSRLRATARRRSVVAFEVRASVQDVNHAEVSCP